MSHFYFPRIRHFEKKAFLSPQVIPSETGLYINEGDVKTILVSSVSEFFRQRAGMFFVLIGVLFGFLSGNEHHAFAVFFLTDRFGMLYLFLIWLSYTIFCAHFLVNLWRRPEYGFIFLTRLWSGQLRFRRFFILAIGLLQPIIFYGIYVLSIAVQDDLLLQASPILAFYVFLSLIIVESAEWRIRNPRLFVKKAQRLAGWQFPRPASWIYWSLEWIVREKGITLLVCKTGASLVFVSTLIYYGTDSYDLRLPAIGLSMGYLLNIGISYELYAWESQVWLWNRSLPFSINSRFFKVALLHFIIILPETLITLRYNLLSFVEIFQLCMIGFSILVLFHAFLYKKNGLLEDTMQAVLLGFIVLTLLILYKINLILISLALLLFAYLMFRKWYGQSNPVSN